MKISMVLCTVNRVDETDRFLQSLTHQVHDNFELIVVDQNKDGRLDRLVENYETRFPVLHLYAHPGLSAARNLGLSVVQGDIVAFPDDDCWYPDDLLEGVSRHFSSLSELGVLSVGRAENERSPLKLGPMRPLTRFNLWGRVPSISLFFRRRVVTRIGGFDETLGLGAGTPWGAGEDTDCVLRAMRSGATCIHDPALRVFHAPPNRNADPEGRLRARSYARGLGRVLRKNRFPVWMVVTGCLLSVGRGLRALVSGNICEARWHYETLVGRIGGWFSKSVEPARDDRRRAETSRQ